MAIQRYLVAFLLAALLMIATILFSMRRLLPALVLLGASLLLTGCIAEFLAEGGAVEGLAGVEAGAATAAEAAEAVAAAAAESEATGTIAARVASGQLAVDSGAMRSVLAELTEGGGVRSLDLDSAGVLFHEGRALAQIGEDGAITVERSFGGRALVGRIADGRLWSVDGGGALRHAIGELRGFVPGSGVELYDNPFSSETTFRVLEPRSVVEVLERRGGWLEIRLVSGEKGWVWSPLVAVTALLGARHDRQSSDSLQPGDEERCVVLASGRVIRGRVLDRVGSGTRLQTNPNEQVALDDAAVARAESCRDTESLDWTAGSYAVALQTGAILYARSYAVVGDAAALTLGDGARVFISRSLLSGPPATPRALESPAQGEVQPAIGSLQAMERSVSFGEPQPENAAEIPAEGPAVPLGSEGWRRAQRDVRTQLTDGRQVGGANEEGQNRKGGFYGWGSLGGGRPTRQFEEHPPRDAAQGRRNTRDEPRSDEPRDGRPASRKRDDTDGFADNHGDRWARPEAPTDGSWPRPQPRNPRSSDDLGPDGPRTASPIRRQRPEAGGFGGDGSEHRQRPEPHAPAFGGPSGGRPSARPAPAPRPPSRPPQTSSGGSHHPHG